MINPTNSWQNVRRLIYGCLIQPKIGLQRESSLSVQIAVQKLSGLHFGILLCAKKSNIVYREYMYGIWLVFVRQGGGFSIIGGGGGGGVGANILSRYKNDLIQPERTVVGA